MIVFDLDGCLADCEHRRHFVDPIKAEKRGSAKYVYTEDDSPNYFIDKITGAKWRPDWQAFYEACDKDLPIKPVIELFQYYMKDSVAPEIQVWSGRCESVRKKTETWLFDNLEGDFIFKLKMRPIGDSTPDDQLKEQWLNEAIAQRRKIDFVFDDRPKVIRMWRRRGIFVFNCCQYDEEF